MRGEGEVCVCVCTLTEGEILHVFSGIDTVVMVAIRVRQKDLKEREKDDKFPLSTSRCVWLSVSHHC